MIEPIDLEPLFPDRASGEALGAQLLRRLRGAVESGFFPSGSRMLPSRELARRLGVSRNTVIAALEQLIAEGYLAARIGAGTFVTDALRDERRRSVAAPRPLPTSPGKLAAVKERLDEAGSTLGPLRVGAPDLSKFPMRTWMRLKRRHLAAAAAHLDYGLPAGYAPLRQAISRHIAQFRGVVADPDQVIIVEGTQGGLHLTSFVLMRCGDTVAIEDPGYQNATAVFAAHGLTLHGVPVDDDGMQTHLLPQQANLAYVTPSHQFPLGGALPLARRTELLEWARHTGAYVVEDDYDSEFGSHPLPALQSLDRDERVIYIGTFSKTLAPGLRLGYVVAPPHLAATFRATREITSLGASADLQATMADFIAQGHFSRHVRRMTPTYERRRDLVIDALSKNLPRGFRVGPAQTGLHVAVTGPPDFDDVRAANSMPDGQRVIAISTLCIDRSDCKGLLMGFSAGSDAAVETAARALALSLRS
jgi:GntR family transcriptional regulator / MocR family aminotransferase